MAIVAGSNLAMSYGPFDIFQNVNISIHHGERAAVVGPNGAGKTTLLRLLAGEETPNHGRVFRARNIKTGFLKQEITFQPAGLQTLWQLAGGAFEALKQQARELAEMEAGLADDPDALEKYGHLQESFELAGGYRYELTMQQVLTGLGFTPNNYDQPLTMLSGGQLTRARLARLLLERPDLLFLDEPTNHLDLQAIEWLESYLTQWGGAVVIVSHDRYFLNKVANRVFELSFNGLERYRGNYSHYLQQRAERFARREKEYRRQQEFIAKEEEFIRRNLAGQRTKEAQGRRKRLERLRRDNLLERRLQHKNMKLALSTDLRSGDLVLATHSLTLGYPGGDVLLSLPDMEIRRGECVALLGPNGSGKTTFLKTILREIPAKAGQVRLGAAVEIGYFAQIHTDLNPQNTLLDELLSVKHNMTEGEGRNHLGRFLFSGDDVFKTVAELSGGERSRLALARFALSGANFLILDEPTNHLDIPSQEILEAVLTGFSGTILLVSHDRYFVNALATHVWVIEDKTIVPLKGNYAGYLAYKEAQATNSEIERPAKYGKLQHLQAKAQKREQEKHARLTADLEERIHRAEARLVELEQAMEAAGRKQNITALQQLAAAYQQTETLLADLFEEWMSMEAV